MPTSSISINWNNIREHNGSSNNGFEELVCQLAHVHTVNDATFIRIGTPDGGVEAYWQFQDGSEYGWQAKYFTSWDNSKWPQIKESLATAVKTHPKLTRYYICTPLDRPDARIPRKKSAMDHWNELVSYSKTLKNEIELVYWGNHELVELLSQPTNSGLRYYWFYQDDLSLQWFSAHIDRSICDLGPRYTPAVNVRQEISQYFDSLRQNDCCYNLQDKHLDTFLNVVNKSIRYYFEVDGSSCVSELRGYLDAIILSYHRKAVSSQMDEVKLTEAINNIRTWLHRNIEILSNHSETSSNNDSINSEKSRIETSLRLLQEIQQALWDFESFIDSSHVKCFNNPSVLLYGDAGSGKSHLLADIATQCLAEEVPCILLLGQQFVATDSPWHQIINSHLRLSCSNEATLLGAINALGMLRNQRILFMIDAINEGAGRKYWPNYLAGFIHEFKKYPYISLVITLRSSYLECFNNEIRDSLYRIEHRGFEDDYLFDAMNVFFRYYDIEQPNVPLLNPEFYNPLFLKLFCSGLQKAGHHSIPKGMLGLKAIFDFFVKTSADAIYHRNNLDQKLKIVPLIIESFAQYTIEKSKNFIPYTDAAKIINSIVMPFGINSPNLLQELIAEGIFSADISYDESWNPLDVVRFSYERLENLIKVQMLLSDVSKDDLKNTFSEKGILFTYMNDTGMLETFSIIIPEKYHCELYSVIDDKTIHPAKIAKAFLYSLLWRNGDSININKGKEYLNTVILRYQSTFSLFIETIYAVATDANHPYNANLLHEWLSKHKLATRDSFWSTHIATHYYPEGNISRLIDWCRYHANNIDFSDQSRLLAGTALSWLFTATNNPLRDNATLALTRLLINHLDIAKELLIKFKNIDDPYVMERIWAAVYGATLNSPEHLDIKALSQWIIDDFFSQEEVYPHILVRDYARNIVEYACLNGKFFLPDKSIIRPPYKSIFPKRLPSDKTIKSYEFNYKDPHFKDTSWSQNAILNSMVTEYGRGISGYGDFGRYVFQARLSSGGNLKFKN